MKILFVLKERFYNNSMVKSYGLMNSSTHVSNYLKSIGHESNVVMVVDGNGIDNKVFTYKPDIVIIEALWVTGDKLKELIEIKRYKDIKWVVRIHSDIGFLSCETLGLKYINDYIDLKKSNLIIAPNAENFNKYLSNIKHFNFKYLPNIISIKNNKSSIDKKSKTINIGCFGALRILKNQVFQAMCAMKASDILNKELNFHISIDANINEKIPNPVLKNLEELFLNTNHKLIKHSWMDNQTFQDLVKKMDLGLQLSFTESFNIVTADFVNNDIPIIVSESIEWMPCVFKTSTTNYDEAIKKITSIYNHFFLNTLKKSAHKNLSCFNKNSEKIWCEFVGGKKCHIEKNEEKCDNKKEKNIDVIEIKKIAKTGKEEQKVIEPKKVIDTGKGNKNIIEDKKPINDNKENQKDIEPKKIIDTGKGNQNTNERDKKSITRNNIKIV